MRTAPELSEQRRPPGRNVIRLFGGAAPVRVDDPAEAFEPHEPVANAVNLAQRAVAVAIAARSSRSSAGPPRGRHRDGGGRCARRAPWPGCRSCFGSYAGQAICLAEQQPGRSPNWVAPRPKSSARERPHHSGVPGGGRGCSQVGEGSRAAAFRTESLMPTVRWTRGISRLRRNFTRWER